MADLSTGPGLATAWTVRHQKLRFHGLFRVVACLSANTKEILLQLEVPLLSQNLFTKKVKDSCDLGLRLEALYSENASVLASISFNRREGS